MSSRDLSSIQDPLDRSDGSLEEDLADSVKKFLLQKAHIGFGFETTGDVVKNTPSDKFPRTSLFPESLSLKARREMETSQLLTLPRLRLPSGCYAHFTVSLKDYISQLKPHPEFKQVLMDALAISDGLERYQEVKRVLSWYGTMFVTSVELGGMKHSTVEKILDGKTTESTVRCNMNVAFGKKFGSAEVEGSVGPSKGANISRLKRNKMNSARCTSIPLVEQSSKAPGFVKWRQSLSNPRKWGVTRVLEVQSAISLIDKDTRLRPALAVFKTPLYRFRNRAGRHTISSDPDPSKLPVNSDGPWVNYGPIGRVFASPLDGTIPCYHIYNVTRHGSNIKRAERNFCIGEDGFWDLGIAFYVHPTRKPGTVQLYRTWNPNFPHDNDWAITEEELAYSKTHGYGPDNGYDCSIYPM
ncbi:hypothetical protein FRC00_007586 [Tulasnella sp. 408]|nr:hypothetical protein FRC00_007586 [Tulasnella sp. 408]